MFLKEEDASWKVSTDPDYIYRSEQIPRLLRNKYVTLAPPLKPQGALPPDILPRCPPLSSRALKERFSFMNGWMYWSCLDCLLFKVPSSARLLLPSSFLTHPISRTDSLEYVWITLTGCMWTCWNTQVNPYLRIRYLSIFSVIIQCCSSDLCIEYCEYLLCGNILLPT